jgi:hypothetical protein
MSINSEEVRPAFPAPSRYLEDLDPIKTRATPVARTPAYASLRGEKGIGLFNN